MAATVADAIGESNPLSQRVAATILAVGEAARLASPRVTQLPSVNRANASTVAAPEQNQFLDDASPERA